MVEWSGGEYDPDAFDPRAVVFDDPRKRWKIAFERSSSSAHVVVQRTQMSEGRKIAHAGGAGEVSSTR